MRRVVTFAIQLDEGHAFAVDLTYNRFDIAGCEKDYCRMQMLWITHIGLPTN